MNKPSFIETDVQYAVSYDYERSVCCCDDDICRCTTIENTRVEGIYVNEVIDGLYRKHSRTDSDIDKYCFDRICYAFKIYDISRYEVNTSYGYYGEEIRGVYFEDEEKIFDAYYEMLALDTDAEKIRYCLNLEYGYIISSVKYAISASIISTHPNKISFPQKEYAKKCDKDIVEEYKDRKLPIAVCVKDDDMFRIIDGYHRFSANRDKKTVKIIVLE